MNPRPDTRITLRDKRVRDRVDPAIRALRARRVSYRAIGEALDVFEGLRLTEGQVRHRCVKLGLSTKGADTLDEATGSINIQHGKGDKAATIKMAAWAWPLLDDWRATRRALPNPTGSLLCVIEGPTAGRAWAQADMRHKLKQIARQVGITKRMSCHQLRHGFAVQAYTANVPLRAIQLHLRHENIGITDPTCRASASARATTRSTSRRSRPCPPRSSWSSRVARPSTASHWDDGRLR